MLTAFGKNEESSNCFYLLGTVTPQHKGGLITSDTSLITTSTSLISSVLANGGLDVCSFYSGPSDSTIIAFGESCGSIAFADCGENSGSIAFAGGGESCGSIASAGSFSCGGSVGGGCSYSC